jgi:hypothetical protein
MDFWIHNAQGTNIREPLTANARRLIDELQRLGVHVEPGSPLERFNTHSGQVDDPDAMAQHLPHHNQRIRLLFRRNNQGELLVYYNDNRFR